MGYYDDSEVVNVLIATSSGCKWTLLRFISGESVEIDTASVMDSRGYKVDTGKGYSRLI